LNPTGPHKLPQTKPTRHTQSTSSLTMFTHRLILHTTRARASRRISNMHGETVTQYRQITREGPWEWIHSSLTSWERSFYTGDPTIPWYHITFWSLTRLIRAEIWELRISTSRQLTRALLMFHTKSQLFWDCAEQGFQHSTTIITYTREEQHIPRLWILTFGGQTKSNYQWTVHHLEEKNYTSFHVCLDGMLWAAEVPVAMLFSRSARVRSPKRRVWSPKRRRGKESNLGFEPGPQQKHTSCWRWHLVALALLSTIDHTLQPQVHTQDLSSSTISQSHCQNTLRLPQLIIITRNTHAHLRLVQVCRLCTRVICRCRWGMHGTLRLL